MKYRNHILRLLPILILIVSAISSEQPLFADAPKRPIERQYANFDVRANLPQDAAPIDEAAEAELHKLERSVKGLQIRFDPNKRTPRILFSLQDALTQPSPETSEQIARGFLKKHRALYGLNRELSHLQKVRDYRTRHNGARHVSLQQFHNGLEIFGAEMRFTLTREGRVVMAAGDAAPDLPEDLGLAAPFISALEALRLAAADIGIAIDSSIKELSQSAAPDRKTLFAAGNIFRVGISHSAPSARLLLFPMGRGHARPAWQIRFADGRTGDGYAIIIDAETGTALLRHNMTWRFQDNAPTYRVYTSNTPQPNLPFVSVKPPFAERELVRTNGDPTASPLGWIDPFSPTTIGNNVIAQEDLDGNDTGGSRPVSTSFVFDYPLTLGASGAEPQLFIEASVTNLFYRCNWTHDYLYKLGFDEEAGNFQKDNFNRGGLGNDPIVADALDGALVNNASFGSSEDGFPGRLQMYLWTTAKPKLDGDYDAEVIVHEYVHGLTTRLVGGPQNATALFGIQSAGMAEGWSDWYAMTLLSKPGDDPRALYPYGSYVTQNFKVGIRRFPYSTDKKANPLTYADIDPSQTRFPKNPTEVHNIGEVWCEALWETRANFIDAYGFEKGKALIEQIVTDSLKLLPINPSFIDGRDAMLAADVVNNGGANQCLIWSGFAKRGIGFGAVSFGGSRVVEDFSLSPNCRKTGSITFDRKGYANDDQIGIVVGDADLIGQGDISVVVTSVAANDRERITLKESKTTPGLFSGSLLLRFSPASPTDGVLQAALGDAIRAVYDDERAEQGQPAQAVAEARAIKTIALFDDDIEKGPSNFMPDGNWRITTETSNSPVSSWTDSPGGNYANRANATLKLRGIDMSGLIGGRLIFQHRYDLQGDFDFAYVEAKTKGKPWTPLASFTGKQPEFGEAVIDLSRFDGAKKLKLRFRLVADGAVTGDGWHIDDVRVVGGIVK